MLKTASLVFVVWMMSVVCYGQDTIPFRVTAHRNIIVNTLVNEKDSLDLMFQIAMADASLVPDGGERAPSILFDTLAYTGGISKNNTLRVGSIKRVGILFFGNEIAGHEADGKIGTALFGGKPFKIDYDHNRFVVYNDIPDTTGFVSVPLRLGKEQFFITAYSQIAGEWTAHEFLLQSGFSGNILYDNEFSAQQELDNKLTFISEKTLRNSVGDRVITKQGIVEHVDVGGFTLKDVPVGVFLGEIKAQRYSYLGADMMHRFNWVIDPDRQMAYIQKSVFFDRPYYPIS